jgi:hypothetical protein
MKTRSTDADTHTIDFRGPLVHQELGDGWKAVYWLTAQGANVVIKKMDIVPIGDLPAGGLTTRLVRAARPGIALSLFQEEFAESVTPGTVGYRAQAGLLGLAAISTALFGQRTLADLKTMGPDELAAHMTPEKISEALSQSADWTEFVEEQSSRWKGWAGVVDHVRALTPERRDRLTRLAATAALYVQATASRRRNPNEWVAAAQSRSTAAVRDDIYAARRASLLSGPAGRGRAGGQLTPLAREILAADDG